MGSPAGYRHLTGALSRAAGAAVLALDYRLAPEHPFPAAIDDAVSAYRWAARRARNKKSVALDLGNEPGGEILLKLIARANVEITNYQPSVYGSSGSLTKTWRHLTTD